MMNEKYIVDDETMTQAVCTGYVESLGRYIELMETELLSNFDRNRVEVLASEYAALLSLRDELDVDEFSVLGDISNGEFELLTADDVKDLIKE